ncbi:asialoglycoprotein receptor 1-like isoform X2 [Acanthopagrus latus]|uniref:asialoglycoprotein receptor 1-like isoform X2 n=1 Tax=Acanthopagrus latus TaxID=8177 RepID=UPI00187CB7E6|nr:asialoglycoprotein receptor 1-like isoform X2 [Acanthopagrus latus]
MVGHRWLPWNNNPTSGSITVTSAKQDQEVYNNKSDSRPEWKSLLFDYQNVSESYVSLSKANSVLRGDNQVLKEQSAWLDEQARLLNRTSAKLMSVNLALSLESTDLMEQIVNLTSTNLQLTQEHARLVRLTSEQEEEKMNTSRTIEHLVESNQLQEQEGQRLSQINVLLREELLQLRDKNEELLEINDRFQGEIKNQSEQIAALLDDCEEASRRNTELQERLTELQEENQNLSSTLMKERQEAAEREDDRRNETERMEANYRSLDLHCPVVNHKTKERICTKCPDSWRLFENKCYYVSSRKLTWSSSRSWCQTQGGDLLVIDSQPEQDFIFESSQASGQSDTRLWIGLTDAEEEGEWFWVDGSSVTTGVQFWLSRPGVGTEPDDWKLDDPLGEDCGHMDTSEDPLQSWMDGSCKTPYRWICEKNL